MKQVIYITLLLIIFCLNSFSQEYKEYYFKFSVNDKVELDVITQIISIDNVKGLEVFAYANQQEFDEFEKLNYKIEFLQKQDTKSIQMATTVTEMATWDKYPTYEVYRQMMKDFEANYPALCKLDSIGTTNNGRKLYVIKISDNVEIEENEPEFFYTSTMHGDETTGFVLMLRLADSLLSSYSSSTRIKNLIDEIEIFINPNANPDGTYYGGNSNVSGAIRTNGSPNYADLNRDFPDPRIGANSPYQTETQAMMDFAYDHNFVMSANFHGGEEVMNYPWDTWYYSDNPHSDTDWFEQICTDYVNTARTINSSYMTHYTSDGVTHGATWYRIEGGRQDYMNFWHQCREVTIEISVSKILATESLNNYWNYNKESLLQYMNECLFGIRGTVTNYQGDPLNAMIWIENHDREDDSSMVFTDTNIGDYHRLIEPGTYDIVVTADGYLSEIANNVIVNQKDITWLNFVLTSSDDSVSLNTDPKFIKDTLFYDEIAEHEIIISNDSIATSTSYNIEIENEIENSWLELNKSTGTVIGNKNDTVITTINTDLLAAGIHTANILLTAANLKIDTVPVIIIVKDSISTQVKPEIIIDTIWGGDNKEYNIVIENNGFLSFNYYIQVNDATSHEWIYLNKSLGSLLITESDTIVACISTTDYGFGDLNCDIIIQKENSSKDTIPVNILVKDTIGMEIHPLSIIDTLDPELNKQYPIVIKNIGNKNLEYSSFIDFPIKSDTWINQDKYNGTIYPEQNDTISLDINTHDLTSGGYTCALIVSNNRNDNIAVPIDIYVKKIQGIENSPDISNFILYPNPFHNNVNISFIPNGFNLIRLSIFNILGNIVYSSEINVIGNKLNNIIINDFFDINQLPNGIYFFQISTPNSQVTRRLLKE